MTATEHKRRDPYLYCETLDSRRVHLMIPVTYQQLTLCRKVVAIQGFQGEPKSKTMCSTCLRKSHG